jgi:hypothetical protein
MFMRSQKRSQNPTMVVNASSSGPSSQRSLLKFLSRSRKKRADSIDSTTVPTIAEESLDYSTTSSTGESKQRRHITSSPVTSSQQGVYSRAANHIRRRKASSTSASSHHTMVVIEDDDGSDCESARLPERVDDRFCKTLNECQPSQIEQLRIYRTEVAPIVCYESDDNDDVVKEHQDAEKSLALKSRLEALEVQQRLLGKDHPDVVFMTQRIRRLQRRGHLESESGLRSSSTPFYYHHHATQ